MTQPTAVPFNPELDLRIERVIPTPREKVWRCWTEPDCLTPWFCPRPWRATECRIDLRPGGLFFTRMAGPEGEWFAGDGSYLEVSAPSRLVWTNAMLPGWRPAPSRGAASCGDFAFTVVLELEETAGGTLYRATALHATPEDRAKHESMGFDQGWNAALDQLVEFAAGL